MNKLKTSTVIFYKLIKNLKNINLSILFIICLFFYLFKDFSPRLLGFSVFSIFFLIFLVALLYKVILKKEKLVKLPQNKILLLFLCFVFISLVSIESISHTIVGLKHVFRVGLLFFLVTNLIKNKIYYKYLVYVLVFSLMLVVIISLFRYFIFGISLSGRLMGLLGDFLKNPNQFALYSIFMIPQVLYLSFVNKTFKKYFSILFLILIIFVIILTSSRGGLVTGLVLLFIFFIKSRHKIKFFLIGLCLFMVGLPFIPFNFWVRIKDLFLLTGSSVLQRLEILYINFKMFLDNIWFGIGIGNSIFRFPEYVRPSAMRLFELEKISHNLYFEVLVELGIFGFLIFLYFLYITFKQTLNKNIEEMYYLRLSLIVFLVGGFFLNVTYNPLFWILLSTIPVLNNIG